MESTINRFSSRRQRLDKAFLVERLRTARSYKRIAGYFRSSLFELVGEEISNIPDVRIVCNSDLDPADIAVSKAARESYLREKWNAASPEVEALLRRQQYRKLYDLLSSGRVQVRVVPRDKTFLHGKAGVIETPEGKTCFLGSINETRSAFTGNYEILWEDTSPEGVRWVEEEFEALWKDAPPLPDAIVEEVKRIADRVEVRFEDVSPHDLPGAVFAESPIYRGGEQLQPWQRSFVTIFLRHRETYGKARLLLADEVGLGKTLSLAASAVLGVLLGDGPVLVLCPSNLALQWQVEIKDRLGLPSAVWRSLDKVWTDPDGRVASGRGPEYVTRCPFQIGIISTGLIFHDSGERAALLGGRYGTVVLDEAHRARRRGALGETGRGEYNNLLAFMLSIGERAENVLLGTATPIQTEIYELWDLLKALNSGADFVLGRENVSRWADWEESLPYVKGDAVPSDERGAWELLRNPLPPAAENARFAILRNQLGLADRVFFCGRPYSDLDYLTQETVRQTVDADFFKNNNPVVRHTVVRRRRTLEELGYLDKIAVNVHPDPSLGPSGYPGPNFVGQSLMTNHPFRLAYDAAEKFTESLSKRTKAAGFVKSLLLQRICSSFASGRATAQRILQREVLEDEEDAEEMTRVLDALTKEERAYLYAVVEEMSRPEAHDPKLEAVKYFLTEHKTEGKTWLEHGCIVFSQYYDTVRWIASELAASLPDEPVAVYAGAGKSGLFRGQVRNAAKREDIKQAVRRREIRLVVATDAACEGLNLQTLGTLINVDLPWNPARLEQRLGRIRRFGQTRTSVDMLNLVYHDTRDEKVYETLSRRFKDRYDIFGALPDVIDDEWIEHIENLEDMMDKYVHLRQKARNAFDLRYQVDVRPDEHRWELCSRVLARHDIIESLSKPW